MQIVWRVAELMDRALVDIGGAGLELVGTDASMEIAEVALSPTKRCALYHEAVQNLGKIISLQFLSMAPDKARRKKRGIFNTYIAAPTNIGLWATPQD